MYILNLCFHPAGMPDSEDLPPPLQPQDSSSSGKRKRNQDRTLTDAELRKKRKRTLKTVANKMGDSSLFSKVLVFAVEPDGELYSFAFPAATRRSKIILSISISRNFYNPCLFANLYLKQRKLAQSIDMVETHPRAR
jgi:hypothetical protein